VIILLIVYNAVDDDRQKTADNIYIYIYIYIYIQPLSVLQRCCQADN